MATDPGSKISRELLFAAFAGPSSETEDPRILERMAAAVETENLRPGDVLFREGDESDHVHFMTDGRMRLTRRGFADWVYEGRWVVGTTDILANRVRTRTATMETEARLFRLPAERWFEVMRDRPEVILNALGGFAQGVVAHHVRRAPTGSFVQTPAPPGVDLTTLTGRVRLLAGTRLFGAMPMQVLAEIASACRVEEVDAGESLFVPGAPTGRVFVVARGRVEASRTNPDVSATFVPGSIVGGAVCLGDPQGAWGARALERAQVLSFFSEELLDHLEHHQRGMRAMMAAFAVERERLCEELAEELGELVMG